MNSVKSCFQNMEICKRRVNMYDTVNQSKTPFITHVAPSTSTNLTMTFNNQLNTVHNQVNGEQRGRRAGLTVSIKNCVFLPNLVRGSHSSNITCRRQCHTQNSSAVIFNYLSKCLLPSLFLLRDPGTLTGLLVPRKGPKKDSLGMLSLGWYLLVFPPS